MAEIRINLRLFDCKRFKLIIYGSSGSYYHSCAKRRMSRAKRRICRLESAVGRRFPACLIHVRET